MIVKFDETPGIAGVYLLICRETREYYVGESRDIVRSRLSRYRAAEIDAKRLRNQAKLANKLHARFSDRGGPQFEMWLLETGLHDDAERLSRETYWDGHWLTSGYLRLNTAPTGGASPMGSAECRAKISESKRGEKNHFFGKKLTAEHRAKISNAHRGKKRPPFTAEHRARLSEAKRGERHNNFGRKLTAEHRAKISEAHRGKILTAEHRAKLSESRRAYLAARKAQTKAE